MDNTDEINFTVRFNEDGTYQLETNWSLCYGSGTLGDILGCMIEKILEAQKEFDEKDALPESQT